MLVARERMGDEPPQEHLRRLVVGEEEDDPDEEGRDGTAEPVRVGFGRLCAASLLEGTGRVAGGEVEHAARDRHPRCHLPGFDYTTAAAVAIARRMLVLAAGDAARALEEARRAEAAETDADGLGRAVASFFVGIVLFFADDQAAEVLLRGFVSHPLTGDQHARAYAALAFLAYIALDRGEVGDALTLSEESLARARTHGLDEYPTTSLARGAVGAALLANGDLDAAEDHLEQAVTLARRGGEG